MIPRKTVVSFTLLLTLLSFHLDAALIFLKPQADCKVKCQNGGFCAYERGNPEEHRCICFIDTYYGELCQYKYPATTTTIGTGEQLEDRDQQDGVHEHGQQDGQQGESEVEDRHGEQQETDDLLRHESEPLEQDEQLHPHSNEVYHEAQIAKEKTSRHVIDEQQHAQVYTESPPFHTEFNRLNSPEYEEGSNEYSYEDDGDWMLVKRGSTDRPSILFCVLLFITVLCLL